MKKLIMVILVVVMAASLILAGCSSTTTTPATTSAPATTAAVATTGAAPTTVAPPKTSSAPPKTSAPPATSMAPPPTTSGTQAKKGGVVRLLFQEVPTGSIGIPENMKGFSMFYSAPVLETFVSRNPDNSYSPELAESWEWTNNNLTLNLKLRQGVKFHDGSDFNATVAKWNFDRALASKVVGSDNIVSSSIIGPYAFQINIAKFKNTWFGSMAGPLGTQISQAYYEKNGAAVNDWNPVGTGPFKFKEYKENNYLELVRNDGYWGTKPLLDGIKHIYITDAVTQQISFEAGEGDVLENAQGSAAADLLKKGYVLDISPGLGTMLVPSSGIADSPYAKPEVRQAIEYAINKDAIIKSIGLGYWRKLTQIVGQDKMGFVPSLTARNYDPAKAKQLLAAAGYPNGFNTKITVAVAFNNDAITAMQADLKAVGINADINVVSMQKWLDNMVNGIQEGLEVEPITTMESDFGVNLERYWVTPIKQQYGAGCWWTTLKRPDGLDQKIQDYLGTPDFANQKTKAEAITKLMYDDETAIPLWESTTIICQQKYVKEMNYGKIGWAYFNYTGAWLDK